MTEKGGTPEGGNPKGTTIFGGIDISTLPEEVQELARNANASMQKGFNEKMESLSTDRKKLEDEINSYRSRYEEALEVNKQWDVYNREQVEPLKAEYYSLKGQSTKHTDDDDDEQQVEAKRLQEVEKNLRAEYQTAIAAEVQRVGNLMTAMNQLNDLRWQHRDNPEFDVSKVIDTARNAGVTDLKTAYKLAYGDMDKETYAKSQIEKAKEEWQQEQAAKQVSVLNPGQNITNPVVNLQRTTSRREAEENTKKQMAEKYGSDFWNVFK